MNDHVFESGDDFKHTFEQGLINLISDNRTSASFILVVANFLQHPDLYKTNQARVISAYTDIIKQYDLAKQSGLKLSDSDDDLAVMRSIIEIGLPNIQLCEQRTCHHVNHHWSIYFNQLRSFRPERMSNVFINSINTPFADDAFHFNKVFLNKEIFTEPRFNNNTVSFFYNKFPFADYHALLVVDRKGKRNQFLYEDIFNYVWLLFNEIITTIPGLILGYNSIGAGASVNHLHFQSCISNDKFPLFLDKWKHNGGDDQYPAKCFVFKNAARAWDCIDELQVNNIPFNLIFSEHKIYCLPRKLNADIDDLKNQPLKQLAWFEMAGNFTVSDRELFVSLTDDKICEILNAASHFEL